MNDNKPKRITKHIQDCFVKLLITDDEFIRMCRPCIEPAFFASKSVEFVIDVCFGFFDRFGRAPKDHIHDEIVSNLDDKKRDEKELFYEYLQHLNELQIANVDYIYRSVMDWIVQKRFEQAAYQFVELIDKGKLQQAQDIMYEALRQDYSHEKGAGTFYADMEVPGYRLVPEEDRYLFRTHIKWLDRWIKGFGRGQLITILGPAKGKKTWFLIHLAKQAIKRGLNVLHISHEIPEEELEMRYDQMIGSMVKEKEEEEVSFVRRNKRGDVRRVDKIRRPCVFTTKNMKKPREAVKRTGSTVVLKKYPMGTMSVRELERYLNWLEVFRKFTPDVIIDDYIEITELPRAKEERDKINKAYIERQRIADQRRVVYLTASQTSKSGWDRMIPSLKHIAEDYRKAANSYFVLGLGGTQDMKDEDVCTVWILAARGSPMNKGCCVQSCITAGQFHIKSWPIDLRKASKSEDKERERKGKRRRSKRLWRR